MLFWARDHIVGYGQAEQSGIQHMLCSGIPDLEMKVRACAATYVVPE